ncbi:heme exporter protein CcmD [Dryocola sp. LX212]
MTSAFTSWADFFAMGGYAFYVWLAVAFTVIPLLGLVVHTASRHRAILNDVDRQQAREQRIRARKQSEGV